MEEENGLTEIKGSINKVVDVLGYVNLRDNIVNKAPDYLPDNVRNAFEEGATCVSVRCWNAAGAMFRKCVDLATKPLLPTQEVEGLNRKQRRDLGLRLQWLFDNQRLTQDLRELSHCIKEDGNDGVHAGELTQADAEDVVDFTVMLLNRMYTEPAKLRLAEERRASRRDAVV